WNISDQGVLREGTAAQTGESRIEAAAAGVVSSKDFFFGLLWTAVQVEANFEIAVFVIYGGDGVSNLFWGCGATGVSKRNHLDGHGLEKIDGVHHFLCTPLIAVGIAESHGDVNDNVESGVVSLALDSFELIDSFFEGLPLVVAQKSGGDRVRKAKRTDSCCLDGALSAPGVHDDADDFDVVWRIKFFEDVFGVGHLRDRVRGYERDSVNVLEASADECFQVIHFDVRGDLAFEALPSIARAFDELDGLSHRVIESFRD